MFHSVFVWHVKAAEKNRFFLSDLLKMDEWVSVRACLCVYLCMRARIDVVVNKIEHVLSGATQI